MEDDNDDFEIVDDNQIFCGADDEINIIEDYNELDENGNDINLKKKKRVNDNNNNNNNNHNNTIFNKQLSEIESIKKKLFSELSEMKKERLEYESLNNSIKKELSDIQSIKVSLEEERTKIKISRDKLKKEYNQLTTILNSMQLVPKYIEKNKEIVCKLKLFYNQTNDFEAEIKKLSEMKNSFEEQLKQQKEQISQLSDKTDKNDNNDSNEEYMTLNKLSSFSCKNCGIDIGLKEEIESKCYQVGQGQFTEKKRGYLFRSAVNLKLGQSKTENFTTGAYQISWVSCKKCSKQMGWKYISADNQTNQTKVGKYCLARIELLSPEERNKK